MRIFFILFIAVHIFLSADEKESVSFYQGYLIWKEHVQKQDIIPCEFEQVVSGMRAAEKGDVYNQEDLIRKIQSFREKIALRQAKENLEDAETVLDKISKEEDSIEIIHEKLYYKRLQKGFQRIVKENDTPLLRFSLFGYSRQGQELLVKEETPIPITLKYTIPGFAKGVVGMHQGEVRRIYVHPNLAYGLCGKSAPNQMLICEVEVIEVAP